VEAPVPLSDEGPVPQNDEVRDVRLPARLYASTYTHRLLPAGPAVALASRIGPAVRRFRNSAERRDGERFMADLLLHTPRAAEADAMAERWLTEKSKLGELFWRPWLLERSRILGREHLEVAEERGRGCLFVAGHIGGHWSVSTILINHGIDHYAVSHPHHWEPMPPGYKGLAKLHLRHTYLEKPLGVSKIILSDGPPERPLRLLEAGNTLLIAFDVAGSAATPFLGRSVALAGGPATLAFRTKCTVIPAVPQRQGTRIDLRLFPPIDPADHHDPRSLREAIAKAFEPVVLEHPESVELAWFPSPLVTESPPAEVPRTVSP
jgi:lauroyl/myristoyl acyltransferase